MRNRHDPIRTEEVYLGWIHCFFLFHGKRHPREMGSGEVAAFLTHLAVYEHVAASTQNQALAALLICLSGHPRDRRAPHRFGSRDPTRTAHHRHLRG